MAILAADRVAFEGRDFELGESLGYQSRRFKGRDMRRVAYLLAGWRFHRVILANSRYLEAELR